MFYLYSYKIQKIPEKSQLTYATFRGWGRLEWQIEKLHDRDVRDDGIVRLPPFYLRLRLGGEDHEVLLGDGCQLHNGGFKELTMFTR